MKEFTREDMMSFVIFWNKSGYVMLEEALDEYVKQKK